MRRRLNLFRLPLELFLMILSFLRHGDKVMLALTCRSMMELLRSEGHGAATNAIFQPQPSGRPNDLRYKFKPFNEFERSQYMRNLQALIPWEYALCKYCWKYKECTQASQKRRPWLIKQSKSAREPTHMCWICYCKGRGPTKRQFFARVSGTIGGEFVESVSERRRKGYTFFWFI